MLEVVDASLEEGARGTGVTAVSCFDTGAAIKVRSEDRCKSSRLDSLGGRCVSLLAFRGNGGGRSGLSGEFGLLRASPVSLGGRGLGPTAVSVEAWELEDKGRLLVAMRALFLQVQVPCSMLPWQSGQRLMAVCPSRSWSEVPFHPISWVAGMQNSSIARSTTGRALAFSYLYH